MTLFRLREKEFWILIGAGLLLFYRPLLLGETFFFRDLYLHFYPQKVRFVELVRGGEFPLWDPFLHGGQPFLADLNNMALYPFNLLYLVLPSVFCFNLDIIFHVLLSAAAAYWVARSLDISPLSSMVAGAVYGFCGYTLSLTNLLSRLTAMPYLPLMVLTLHGFFTTKRKGLFVLCALFGALQVLAGAPEMTLLTFITLLGWTYFSDAPAPVRGRFGIYLVLALFVAGLSAIQIIPTAEMVEQSVRSSHSDYDSFSAWSLNLKRIPEMLFSGFLGYTNLVSKSAYWGANFESMGFPFILSIYFGWFALSLCTFGVLFKTGSQRLRLFLAMLLLFAIVISLGRHLAGFRFFYENVPFAGIVRYPIKFMALSILPVALLAAFGLDSILRSDSSKRPIVIYFWVAAAGLGGIALLFTLSPAFANTWVTSYFGKSSNAAVEAIGNSFIRTALFCLCVAFTYQYWIVNPGKLKHAGLVASLLFDLILNAFLVNHFAPREFFTRDPELVKTVKGKIGNGRFYRSPDPPNLVVKLPSNDTIYLSRWGLETLRDYAATTYSIPIIYHDDFDNLAKKEIARISDHLLHASWEQRLPFLYAGGVSVFMTVDRLTGPSIRLLNTIRTSSDKPLFLYSISDFNDIAFFPKTVKAVQSQEEIFKQMNNSPLDATGTAFILDSKTSTNESKCWQTSSRISERKANSYKIQTRSNCDAYLYFAQPFYRGWTTRIDGKVVPSLVANYAFSASFVPAGEHKIERFYKPGSVTIGLLISVFSFAVLFIWQLTGRKSTKSL